MRAWQFSGLGQPPVDIDLARPVPGPGQALVRVAAAGVNFADLLMAEGRYQQRPPLPFTAGMEMAGTVESLGDGARGPAPGSRVSGVCGTGAFAEYVCLDAALLTHIPDEMPFVDAAAFQIAYGTSHMALAYKARLQPGETLFVTGAAGGVGLTAVEIGKRLGARVIASARGQDKLAVARQAGADLLIDSDSPDLTDALKAAGGVDVVYDVVGGPALTDALRATKPDGRLLAIGFASGEVPQIPANQLLVRNLTVIGFWYGGYQTTAPALLTQSMATLIGWYRQGGLRPHVSHALSFDELPQAYALLRSRAATGKVVIRVGDQEV